MRGGRREVRGPGGGRKNRARDTALSISFSVQRVQLLSFVECGRSLLRVQPPARSPEASSAASAAGQPVCSTGTGPSKRVCKMRRRTTLTVQPRTQAATRPREKWWTTSSLTRRCPRAPCDAATTLCTPTRPFSSLRRAAARDTQPHMRPTAARAPLQVAPFLIKLFEIVSSPASDNLVCWSEHGESFKIVDRTKFAQARAHRLGPRRPLAAAGSTHRADPSPARRRTCSRSTSSTTTFAPSSDSSTSTAFSAAKTRPGGTGRWSSFTRCLRETGCAT